VKYQHSIIWLYFAHHNILLSYL